MKFPIKDLFSKCDQIRSFQWIWSHLLKKSLMENFMFYGVFVKWIDCLCSIMEFLFARNFCIWTLIIQFLYSVHMWEDKD